MPGLNDLQTVSLRGRLIGAYDDQYLVAGLDTPVSSTELLTYILDNLGGGTGTGINDVTEGTTDPSGAPGAGEPSIYQNTSSGTLFVWDGSNWEAVIGGGENDITENTGIPSGAPGAGEPLVYQDTNNGNLYVWNSSSWVLVSGGENDITEGAGTPSGAPGAGEPVIYQDTTNGNVYTWDGSQWNIMAVVASNGLTKTGADIELGGTLEKDTDVEVSSFTMRFGRLLGTLLAYWRIVPGMGLINLFTRDDSVGEESELRLSPGSALIEVDDANDVTQLSMQTNSFSVSAGEVGGNLYNRILLDNAKTEIRASELQLKTPDAPSSSIGDVLTILDPVTGQSDFRPPSGGGLTQYEAAAINDPVDDGAFVTASGAGITYERTGGAGQNTEGIATIPVGVIPLSITVHFSSGQAPGNTFFLNMDYTGTNRPVNGSQDTVIPPTGTVATKPETFTDANPATNFIHSGTPIQIGIAQVDDNGTRTRIRYKITNYSQQVGSNASILSLKLS